MKLIHLSDLHIGKRVNEFSMLNDQVHILSQVIRIVEEEQPDAVLIAGDIYDKSVPSAEAVALFDDFLVRLAKENASVFLISGNHDSPERLAFGNRLIDASGIHIAPVYNGSVVPFSLFDEYGPVNIYLLPFLKPANVRRFYPEDPTDSYTDAVRTALAHLPLCEKERNVLVTHQFITGASRSESEDLSVGGADNVDVSVLKGFDYVALGHIHGPQNIGSPRIRYCGSPLKYSFSESSHTKSVTVAQLAEKGSLRVRTVPLVPLHEMAEIKGLYRDLTLKSFYQDTSYVEDYMHITLTDEEDIPDAVGKLRAVYHNLMKLDYDNQRTRHQQEINGADAVESRTPLELFCEFYELQNNAPLSEEQLRYMKELVEKVWEHEN